MTTRSTIAIQNLDGSVHQIYCHWDGYVSNNGRILKEFYNTPDLVKQLVSIGDLSILDEKIEPEGDDHTFNSPEKGVCVYYGRDRGETDAKVKKWDDFDYYRLRYQREEYNYLFVEEELKWYLVGGSGLLMEFLEELDNEENKEECYA